MDATNRQLTAIDLGDSPRAWEAAGFSVVDGAVLLGNTLLRLSGSGDRVEGWAVAGVDHPIDGLPAVAPGANPAPNPRANPSANRAAERADTDALRDTVRHATAPRVNRAAERADTDAIGDTVEGGAAHRDGDAVHPNGIVRIDHVVVRSGDSDRTVAEFERAGLDVRGERSTNSYGSPMRQTFLWAGDVIVELIAPDAGEPRTDEPTSIFGLALSAADLDATSAYLGELLGTPKAAVQPGRRIAGLRGAKVGISVPVAVMSPHV